MKTRQPSQACAGTAFDIVISLPQPIRCRLSSASAAEIGWIRRPDATWPCYHFATQLDETRWNGPIRRRDCKGALGLKTLTKWDVTERAGMAKTELQNRCSTAELTRQINSLAASA